MSSGIETLVRPFVPFPLYPSTTRYRVNLGVSDTEQVLGGGGGREIQMSLSAEGKAATWPDTEKFKETGRESKQVRVENPNDSDQFVEFCQATSVKMHREPGDTSGTPRTSSYTTHDASFTTHPGEVKNRNYGFNYDKENKTCKPQKKPATGCT